MGSSLPIEMVVALIALVAGMAILGCLRVIGYEYYNAVLWHNLKVECHRLRLAQQRQLEEIAAEVEAQSNSPAIAPIVNEASSESAPAQDDDQALAEAA